jgi:hypothetical protein
MHGISAARVGVGQTAADRSAVANRIVGDVANRCGKERMREVEAAIVLDVAPACTGTQTHACAVDRDVTQPVDSTHVDE